MTHHEKLLAEKAALCDQLSRCEREDLVRLPDALDEAVSASERDLTMSLADTAKRKLRMVCDALERIRRGTYGACQHCGDQIEPARLMVSPWVESCISCQEREERRPERSGAAARSALHADRDKCPSRQRSRLEQNYRRDFETYGNY